MDKIVNWRHLRIEHVLLFILLLIAVLITSQSVFKTNTMPEKANAKTLSPNVLPPIPSGLPNVFGFGLFNAVLSDMHAGVPYTYRYQYMAGDWINDYGPNYVRDYINQTPTGTIPGFIIYRFCSLNGNGNCTPETEDPALSINNTARMREYYDEFKYLMQQIAQTGRVAIVILEPDAEGYMQQHTNGGDNAANQTASVASSGMPEFNSPNPVIPNTYRGFHEGLVRLRDLYAPNAKISLTISLWGTGVDMTLCLRDGYCNATEEAIRIANYFNTFGSGWDLVAFDPLDRDAAYYIATQGSCRWWWDDDSREPKFSTFRGWLGTIVNGTQKRAIMWQVPNGNRVYKTMNNTNGHYQDNRTEYFLNSTNGRQHITEWADAGLIGIMWGAGVGSQTHYWDYRNDGVTNPTALNPTGSCLLTPTRIVGNPMGIVNSQNAPYADDDGGYIRINVGSYYTQGAIPLPGSNVTPSPTATPTPVPPTPTFTPTPTVDPGRADINRDGVVNSVDFSYVRNQSGLTCQQVPQPPSPTPPVPCADVNCDGIVTVVDFNLLRTYFGQSFSPPAPSCVVATPTPTASQIQTITFDEPNAPPVDQPLIGQFPTGVINWGTSGVWLLSGPFRLFTTNSLTYTNSGVTSAVFNFVTPKILTSIKVYNGSGSGISTNVTISCGTNPTLSQNNITPGTILTLTTNWQTACTTVTLTSSNGNATNFDDLMFR